LDNKSISSEKAGTEESDRQESANIEKLKFEVAQEMGIKSKAKNKKN
jgi:hypothetical protein